MDLSEGFKMAKNERFEAANSRFKETDLTTEGVLNETLGMWNWNMLEVQGETCANLKRVPTYRQYFEKKFGTAAADDALAISDKKTIKKLDDLALKFNENLPEIQQKNALWAARQFVAEAHTLIFGSLLRADGSKFLDKKL